MEELKRWAADTHKKIWDKNVVGAVTKILWGLTDIDRTRTILRIGKRELNDLIGSSTALSAQYVDLLA